MKPKEKTNSKKPKLVKFINQNWIATLVFLLLLAVLAAFLILNYLEESKQEYREWLAQNCECTEWEGELSCRTGFELDDEGICVAEGKFTSPRIACSQYNCSGGIIELK